MRPILFLDVDDVICINSKYGGYDVFAPDKPTDLYEKLFHPPAVRVLVHVVEKFNPVIVLTTSWLRFLDGNGFDLLFRKTGLQSVADALHGQCEAPSAPGGNRLAAIEAWQSLYYRGEAFAVLDDALSGSGLRGSSFDRAGRVIWCEVNVGLEPRHIPMITKALKN